ncbi:50S rRNA methyltransferase [Candidatus Methylomirabilis lanthanidiphila]|uniref:Probable dual-specificity RNA methyltransferase RlmN n=1 Tax=Candidatus Methylomirabilis lanthanidiphila TaxID=2211376 RepID=A0A564ZNI1_9BACT|nr:23S rRNA (adenine(2503)-C(2))-methyltransferase RlmN [Candidatus Methylomirabilis lanthanidiphila]VUZ86098.1 50S rRNA methyltransferase [Candidatus Methylomirabilis lanthanidiphila]
MEVQGIDNKIDLKGLSLEEMERLVADHGEPSYRGRQLFHWVYGRGARTFAEMTDLSVALRAGLAEQASISALASLAKEVSRDGTRKYLFGCADGRAIETVLIPDEGRLTACLSTQVGCALACAFCLTGTMGFVRHLQPGEIVDQVLALQRDLQPGERIGNLVLMGMGEPLHNYDATVKALAILVHPLGLAYPPRRIALSTVGLVPEIVQLGRSGLGVNLAVSLHASTDELRDRLVPINRRYPLKELMAAVRAYPLPPRRRITFEYVMIDGVNDRPEDAREMVRLLHGLRCKVNLLSLNEAPAIPFRRPSIERVETFQHILKSGGIVATIRESRGLDISAACGLLATEVNQKSLDTSGCLA